MGAVLNLQLTAVENSVSVADNTSQVRIALTITTDSGTYNETGSTSGNITLGGSQIVSLAGKKVHYNTTTTLYDGVHTVRHDADGSKTVAVKASFDVETSVRWIYAEKTLALPRIPRASTMTVPPLTLGQPGTLRIEKLGDFTHTITYRFGAHSGTVTEGTAESAVVWTPPLDLAQEIPNAPSGEGVMTLTTWSGGTAIGSREVAFTAQAGDSLAPQVTALTVEAVSDNPVVSGWGAAVKGKTRLSYAVEAQAQQGASITGCTLTCAGASGAGLTGETGLMTQAGTFVPRAVVTDSRGKTAVIEGAAITVYDCALPAFTRSAAFRADEDGYADGSGSYAAVSAAATCSPVGGHNTLTLRARYRAVNGQWSGYTPLTDGVVTVLPGFAAAVSYEVEVEAIDALGSSRTVVYTIPTAEVAFHLKAGGSGAAFGKYAEQAGWLESDWPVDLRGNRLAGLGQAQEEGDAVSLALLQQRLAAAADETAQQIGALQQQLDDLAAPDMVPGQEYLTGEKWNGAPVYTTVVDYGALPNSAEGSNYALAPGLNVIDIRGFAVGEQYIIPIPGYYAILSMGYNRATGNLWIATTIDMSGYQAYITVKYTK